MRYCRGRNCGYDLRGLPASTTRCPECGRPFDPADPKTYRSRPLRRWLRYVKRAALGLAALLVILAGTWGWFFWGWYDEQQALRALKVDPNHVGYAPILTPWPKQHLGPAGFVLDRVVAVYLAARSDVTDFAPLVRLTNLQRLDLAGTGVTDLTSLARLRNLQHLWLNSTAVTDIAPLARLTKLQELNRTNTRVTNVAPLARLAELQRLRLADTGVTDIAPLARLTNLQHLWLNRTGVTDLAPLAGLTKLQLLMLDGTGVTDFAPLAGLKLLRYLTVPGATITEAQAHALYRDHPDCMISRQ